jgi:hypothetical protein
MRIKSILLFVLCFSISGCYYTPWVIKSNPEIQTINNDLYSIKLKPIYETNYGYTAFDLTIINKTNDDIELNWDRTYYLSEGQTTGGFMFEGVIYKDRNEFKPPDIIFPKITFNKILYPCILANFNRGWYHSQIPTGETGIYITLKVNGKDRHEKLLLNTSAGYDEGKREKTFWGRLFIQE